MKLQRKGPGRLCNCGEKGRDGCGTAAKAGTAMKLQRKGPGRLWNCSEKCRDAYRLAAKRAAADVIKSYATAAGRSERPTSFSRFQCGKKRKTGKLQRFQRIKHARTRKTRRRYNRAGTGAHIKCKRKKSRTTEARTLSQGLSGKITALSLRNERGRGGGLNSTYAWTIGKRNIKRSGY